MNNRIRLFKKYFIHPYSVGKGNRSSAMTFPIDLVRTLGIHPSSVILMLKVIEQDTLELRILRTQDFERKKKLEKKEILTDALLPPNQQVMGGKI